MRSVKELDLAPALVKSLERALRPDRRGSIDGATGRSGGSSTGRSTGTDSEADEARRVRFPRCLAAWERCCDVGSLPAVWCNRHCPSLIAARYLAVLYLLALLLAMASVFLPTTFLSLTNDDHERWTRDIWEAVLLDALVFQPMILGVRAMLRVTL